MAKSKRWPRTFLAIALPPSRLAPTLRTDPARGVADLARDAADRARGAEDRVGPELEEAVVDRVLAGRVLVPEDRRLVPEDRGLVPEDRGLAVEGAPPLVAEWMPARSSSWR